MTAVTKMVMSLCISVFVLSCSSAPYKLTQKIDGISIPKQSKNVKLENFWDFAKNLEPEIPEEFLKTKDERTFYNGLKKIQSGDYETAEQIFSELHTHSSDSLTVKNAKRILVDILFYKSKWKELIELDSAETAIDSPENSLRLAKAFAKVSPEFYYFPSEPQILPISLSPSGCPILEVYVNGHRRFFWLDTGANYSVISYDIAQESFIFPITYDKAKALTGTSIKVDIYPTLIDSLEIGGIKVYNHPFIIVQDFDLKFKLFGTNYITKIDGIIGWKALQYIDTEIDFKNLKAIFKKPELRNNSIRNMIWLGCPIVKIAAIDGTILNFGIDLGAEKTTITENIFSKISFDKIYSTTRIVSSAGGWVYNNARMISSIALNFGKDILHFDDISTGYQQKRLFAKLDGIFGTDFMRLGKIHIDCQNGLFEYQLE